MKLEGKAVGFHSTRGFSLVELAVAVAALGVLTWAVASSYAGAADGMRARAQAEGEQLRAAVRAFALTQRRLPCPDADGDGWEDIDASGTCPAGTEPLQVGWFPYRSLGRDLPQAPMQALYGVYRNPAADADLAVLAERSGDAPGDAGYRDVRDLVIGLNNAAAQPLAAERIHLSGDLQVCAPSAHAGFVLVFPLEDRDGDGERPDGIHAGPPDFGRCYRPPAAATAMQDDVTLVESFGALAGWLNASAT